MVNTLKTKKNIKPFAYSWITLLTAVVLYVVSPRLFNNQFIIVAQVNNPPGKAVLTSPTGIITDSAPVYTWEAVEDSSWYYLWVGDHQESEIFKKWYKTEDICNSQTCTIVSEIDLNNGHYKWWIQTWNDAGYGPWSDEMIFTISPVPPEQHTYFVSTTGDDHASGTIDDPWLTLQTSVNKLLPGDTLYIRTGSYSGFEIGYSGALKDYPIVITAYQDEPVNVTAEGTIILIEADYIEISGLKISGGGNTWWGALAAQGTTGVSFKNNQIESIQGTHGILFYQSKDILAENNIISDISEFGLRTLEVNNGIVRSNQVTNSGWRKTDDDGSGIILHDTQDVLVEDNLSQENNGNGILTELNANNITIRNNTSIDNGWAGIWLHDDGPYLVENNHLEGNTGGIWIGGNCSATIARNIIIKNNNYLDSATKGHTGIWIRDSQNVHIYHNVIYSNGYLVEDWMTSGGIVIGVHWPNHDYSVQNTIIRNNIVANNIGPQYKVRTEYTSLNNISDHNLWFSTLESLDPLIHWGDNKYSNLEDWQAATNQGLGSISKNPQFIQPEPPSGQEPDFHLNITSPAIDAGVDIGQSYQGTAPDMGVYEHESNTPTLTPTPTFTPTPTPIPPSPEELLHGWLDSPLDQNGDGNVNSLDFFQLINS